MHVLYAHCFILCLHFISLRFLYTKQTKQYTASALLVQAFRGSDSAWARTIHLYPVKVALSQLSYGIILIGTNINISNCIYKAKLTMTISTLNLPLDKFCV